MSEATFTIRFDGPIFDGGHKMAVEDFAPAILALSELVKRANTLMNGDRAAVRAMIDVDVEQHCLQFDFQILQSVWDQAKALFTEANIKSASDIGTALLGTATIGVGLFAALKKLRGKSPKSAKVVMRDGNNVTQINFNGGSFFVIPDTARLLKDPQTLKHAKKALEPITKPGYEKLEFEDRGKVIESVSNEDARLIQDMPIPQEPATQIIPASRIRATVGVRRAVYAGNGKWTIQYDKSREMAVADERWLAAFQARKASAPPGYLLDVDMVVSAISVDERGEPIEEPEYKIVKVHKAIPPSETGDLPFKPRKRRGLDV
jgi:hypothetical protein